jgi:hypothetical protein
MRQTSESAPSGGVDGVCNFSSPFPAYTYSLLHGQDLTLFFSRPPPETFRTQQKTTNDRPKPGDGGALLNQENRRPPHDRNGSRNASSTSHTSWRDV